MMQLKVLLPNEVLVNEAVRKVIAESHNGYFCLLPRHIGYVSALVPGLLYFEKEDGGEEYVAVDEGILVKCGSEVSISTQNAIRGHNLGDLRHVISQQFRQLTEQDRVTRSALTNLHADIVRRLLELRS